MRTWWLIGVIGALGACNEGSSRKAAPPAPPLDGARTTARSMPRADWPCGSTLTRSDGWKVAAVYTYGDLAACTLPIVLHAEGVTGCPTRRIVTTPDGATNASTYTYDAQGRLIDADGLSYTWQDDVAVGEAWSSRTRSHYETPADPAINLVTYLALPVVEGKRPVASQEINARYRVEDGRLREKLAGDGLIAVVGGTVLEWNGNRLTATRTARGQPDWVNVYTYDCAAPPP